MTASSSVSSTEISGPAKLFLSGEVTLSPCFAAAEGGREVDLRMAYSSVAWYPACSLGVPV